MKFPHEMDSHAYIKKKKLFSYYPIVTSRKKSETSSLDNNVHLMWLLFKHPTFAWRIKELFSKRKMCNFK